MHKDISLMIELEHANATFLGTSARHLCCPMHITVWKLNVFSLKGHRVRRRELAGRSALGES